MLKPGTVVMQEKALINNRVEVGNKRRMSIVLFSENIDGEDYVCSCPITSTLKNINNNPQDYCYIPYLILGPQRLGVVRISDMSFWKEDSVHPVGLEIELNHLQKIYNGVLNYKPSTKRANIFGTAQRYIANIDLLEQIKEEQCRKKAERKAARKDAKVKRKQ